MRLRRSVQRVQWCCRQSVQDSAGGARKIARRHMKQMRDVRLDGGHLFPVNWHVRDAVSPVSNSWGWRWWALLVCDQGLVVLRWPASKSWRVQLRLGLRGGPPGMLADRWPLTERGVVTSRSALIFARDHLTGIQFTRGILRNKVHLYERNGEQSTFLFATRHQADLCAHLLRRHHFDQFDEPGLQR